MKVTGPIHPGYNYVVAGNFNGGDCRLLHFLRQVGTVKAVAFCGAGPNHRMVGWLAGGPVTVSPDGTTIAATFHANNLPSGLAEDRILHDLFSFTCKKGANGVGCGSAEVLDLSKTDQDYRL